MTPERWRRVERIFHEVLEAPPDQRTMFLDQACSEDGSIRREVESLLASNEEAKREDFLKSPINLEQQRRLFERLNGETLDGKYRIERLLGQGGMGAVFLATHIGTDRHVAVKVISPQFMAHKEFVERFRREARAMGRLRHPNVVNVTDFGFASAGNDQIAYLVMEYLDGSALGEMMKKKGKLSLELVVDIVEQTCLAMEEAHKQGIIHRDLKPDNIWLEPNGRGGYNVKVLDFGLAKLREAAPSTSTAINADALSTLPIASSYQPTAITAINPREKDVELPMLPLLTSTNESRILIEEEKTRIANRGASDGQIDPRTVPEWMTRVGMVLGTPLYMSPEQCRGDELDARSDVYSLGVVVYEMLASETPFTGDMHQLIVKHSDMPPPSLRDKRRDIPKAVANLVMSALAKNPTDRPFSASAFSIAFRNYAEGEIPVLQQANSLYEKNYSIFIRSSALIFIPFLLLCGASALISNWLLLSTLLLLPLADALNIAVCAIIVNRLHSAPSDRLQIGSVFKTLLERAPTIAAASIINVYHPLCGPVIAIEGERTRTAGARAKDLASKARSQLTAIRINNFFISIVTAVLLAPLSAAFGFFSSRYVFDPAKIVDPFFMFNYVSIFMAAALFMTAAGFGRFSVSIATVLLYFRSRRMGGEALNNAFDEAYAPERPASSYKRSLGFIGSVLVKRTLTILSVAAFLFMSGAAITKFFTVEQTNLSTMARIGSPELVKEILASGADVNGKDLTGGTALAAAAEEGNIEVINVLLAAGADINAKDELGNTALMRAAEAGREDVVRELLASGADKNARDNIGRTALTLAMEKRRSNIVELLRSAGAADED